MTLARTPAAKPPRTLTGIRAVAAWVVVVYHFREYLPLSAQNPLATAADHGNLAVDLFFVLSGYVMTANYERWFRSDFRLSNYTSFLQLRLSRIYPLHVMILAAFIAVRLAAVLHSPTGKLSDIDWSYALLSLGLVQSWGVTHEAALNVPAWSVSTEWFAYLLFPMLVVSLPSARRNWWPQAATMALIAAAFAVASTLVAAPSLGWMRPSYCMLRCVAEFSIGICVCRATTALAAPRHIAGILLCCATLLAAGYVLQLPDYTIVPLLFAALVLLTASDDAAWSKPLRANWLQWLGEASYATYISHFLVKDVVKLLFVRPGVPPAIVFPTYLAAVLLTTILLHVLVEVPCQRLIRRGIASPRLDRVSVASQGA